jgi:hypothetical protein
MYIGCSITYLRFFSGPRKDNAPTSGTAIDRIFEHCSPPAFFSLQQPEDASEPMT